MAIVVVVGIALGTDVVVVVILDLAGIDEEAEDVVF